MPGRSEPAGPESLSVTPRLRWAAGARRCTGPMPGRPSLSVRRRTSTNCCRRLWVAPALDSHRKKCSKVTLRDGEIFAYCASYITPTLAALEEPSFSLIALGGFVFIGMSFLSSNMVRINPILSLRGYHLVDVCLPYYHSSSVLTKGRLHSGAVVRAVSMGQDLYLRTEVNSVGVVEGGV